MGNKSAITAGVFHFPPFSYHCDSEDGFCGVEVTLLKTVSAHLGLDMAFAVPSDGKLFWGSIYDNGTADGLIGDVVNGVVDVGAAEFFNLPYRNDLATPSDFYNYDYFCYLLAKAPQSAEWLQVVRPFAASSWFAILIVLLASWGFLAIYRLVKPRHQSVLLEGLSFFYNQPHGIRSNYGSAAILAAHLSLMGQLLSLFYASNLYSFLSLTVPPEEFHLMEDLLSIPGMEVGTTSHNNRDDLAASLSPGIRRLADRFVLLDSWQEGMDRVAGGGFAFMNSQISSEYNIRTRFLSRHGLSNAYVMEECWSNHQIVLYFPKDSHLAPRFNAVLQRLREAGLVTKWIADEMDKLARVQNGGGRVELSGESRRLSLGHLRLPLVLWIILISLAFATFLLEFLCKYFFAYLIKRYFKRDC